jgi:hypothetical protein
MAEPNLQLRVEELLAGGGEPPAEGAAPDAALAECWTRQRRVHLLIGAHLGAGDPERAFAAIAAARSSGRREAIASGIGRRIGRRMGSRRGRGWLRWAAAAAALLVAGLAWRWYAPAIAPAVAPDRPDAPAPMATLAATAAGLVVERGASRLPPVTGMALQPGDLLASDVAGAAVVYSDGSRVILDPASRVAFAFDDAGGKQLRLDCGAIAAVVTPQPAGRPLRLRSARASAEVVGTEFRFAEEPCGAALSVSRGVVMLAGPAGGAPLPVAAGQQALATWIRPPELVPAFDAAGLVARPLDPCDAPATWSAVWGNRIGLDAVADPRCSGGRCLRFAFDRDAGRRGAGSRAIDQRLTTADRALRVRLRVERAEPRAMFFVDVAEDDGDVWRLAEWPIAAGGGWRTVTIPLPPPGREPPASERPEGHWQVERVHLVYLGMQSASATVCVDELEALGAP